MRLRSLWFGTKLAAIFSAVGIALLLANIVIGRYTFGDFFHERMLEMRAGEIVLFAQEYERRLGDHPLESARSKRAVTELAREFSRSFETRDLSGRRLTSTSVLFDEPHDTELIEQPCGNRRCQVSAERPGTLAIAPLMRNDQRIGSIAMTRRAPDLEIFIHFTVAILLVHLLALFVIIGVSYRITQPLRQVTRSMDRIASGDLNERVDIKGRDEIAHMSNSFNSMADRVSSMVRGGREVLAGVSHELRSPLSRMKLSLEMLRESGAKSKHVGSIEEDIDELDGMVDELLTASRLDLGTETLRPEAIKLTELIDEGWHRVAVTPEGKSIDLERALEPEDLSVRVDRALGTRILGNLFENAARYGEGSPVAVKARELDDRVVISVADRGPGVTEDALDKLFIAFYRADSSRSRKTGGTGLGLMIVKRAVEAHGGSIAAANRQAEGLVITFDLPKV